MSTPDPLSPKSLPGPGLRQWLREAFTGRPTPLLCMQVEVSSVCACRCTYCPHTTKKDVWQSRLMSAETFAALWPLMRQCGRVHLQGWGEPFLHPRFMDFVGVARRAGCAVSTTTCGQHMDESLAAAIVDSGMDVVAFSLAGTDEASNASRQGMPFSRVCEAVRCLQDVRHKKQGVHLEVHLAYLLLPSQLEAVKRLPELMEELDVHCAVVSTMDYIASPELAAEAYSPEEADKVAAAAAVLAPVAARVRQSGRELWYALTPGPWAACATAAGKTWTAPSMWTRRAIFRPVCTSTCPPARTTQSGASSPAPNTAAPPGSWPGCGAPRASGIFVLPWPGPGPTCPARAVPSVSKRSGRAGGSFGMRGEGAPFGKKVPLPPSNVLPSSPKTFVGRMAGQGPLRGSRYLGPRHGLTGRRAGRLPGRQGFLVIGTG